MRLIRAKYHVGSNMERPAGTLLPVRGFQSSGHQRGMTEEISKVKTVGAQSSASDCNSNHTSNTVAAPDKNGETTSSYISNASSQDVDFIQDNSDYQWFLDYGYRDGPPSTHHSHHHTSVLSSLATSYACDDLSYYDDMARNLDANLAEVDMEDFRTEDIHSILTTLPTMCCGELQSEREGEMFASVSGSMMAKFDFDSSISPHTSSQGEDSAGSTDTMSICKSELLFSPVKECPLPSTNFSVDSLDCDLLTEHDIMLTCQANKDNYTIAFEGSMTLYSEDSDYHEAGGSEATTSGSNNWSSTRFVKPSSGRGGGGSHPLDTSMARSDSVYTTWSKLKKRSSEVQLTRHPSGNNNTTYPEGACIQSFQPVDATALKSQSMPNLSQRRRRCLLASVSSKLSSALSSSMESETRTRLPSIGGCMKLYDVQHHHNSSSLLSAHSETNSSVDGASSCSGGGGRKQHNFSLVKLFMKQKSVSNEGMCYAMDQSYASECWPASNNSQSEGESDSYNQDSTRQRSCPVINTAAPASILNAALGLHGAGNREDGACGCLNDCRCELHDTENSCDNGNKTRADYGAENGNDHKTTADTLDGATNNWIRGDDAATDYSTCCFEDSLVEPSRKEDSYMHRQHELIEEEEEHASDRSESVEQLSESVSKIEESTLDIGINSCNSDQQEEQCSNSSHTNTYKLLKPKCSSSIAKNVTMFNINNNNSIEKEDIQILQRKRQEKGQSQGTQTKRLNSSGSSTPSLSGESISNCSSSEETEPTRLQNFLPSRKKACSSPATITSTKNIATQIPVHLMHRSIQTSGYADVNMLKSIPFKLLESPNGTSLVKIILPDLKTLPGEGILGDEAKKPLYVFYPNYTLPDLAFLREKQEDLNVAKIFLMPQKFSPSHSHEPDKTNSHARAADNKKTSSTGKSQRPFSCNDVETLRKKGFAHIQDWDSLTFLLPREYRQILAEVPEIVHHLKGKNEDSLRPLFCVSPPLRPCSKVSRPLSCDCASVVTTAEGKPLQGGTNTAANVSSSSSTATQPSSGYRGSSTILTDSSSNHNPSNYNPLFVYRYDSVSSESSLMMNQQKPAGIQQPPAPPLPKRSISLPAGREDSGPVQDADSSIHSPTPPRPPLPRGILRKSLESSNNSAVHYNCKAHKNSANSKRYSMFELGDMSEGFREGKNKRRSLQDNDFSEYAASPRKTTGICKVAADIKRRVPSEKSVNEMEDEDYDDEGVDAGTDSSLEEGHLGYQVRPPTPPIPRTPEVGERYCFTKAKLEEEDADEDEVLQLKEFLQMSGLSVVCSGESLKEWNEADMLKLRQQVSMFLSSKQNGNTSSHQVTDEHCGKHGKTPNNTPEHHGPACDCCNGGKATGGKKTVSFAEKVCVHVRETGSPTEAANDRTLLHTPPNSPNVSTTLVTHRAYQCKLNPPLVDMPIREESDSSPDGYASPPSEGTRVSVVPSISVAQRPIPVDLAQKRALVTAVSDAVEQMICHFSAAENQAHCSMLGDSTHTPACAQLALSKLCPALYAVLSDGLHPTLDTAFGSIQNSVWQVVEASAQQGLMTKALNDLVLRLNGEDVLTEGLMKFNAFVFGLLNVRSLDAWAGYLRTRESVLRKHYAAEGLLLLANTAGASVRALMDQLLASLQPLSLLPFKLDLLFEVRQLHHSLRRMGSLPQPDIASQQPTTSSSPTSGKSWTLLKFVRSIQNSLSQSGDEENQGGCHHRRPVSAEVLPRAEESAHHPNCTAGSSNSPPLPDLLDSFSSTHKQWTGEDKPRPRSCVDNTVQGTGGFSLVTDIASTVKKRWSGIQLGSKLFQAFDRLAAEDTEEEYSDSLENKPGGRRRHTSGSSNNSTSDDYVENITRDESVSPAPLLNVKATKTDETRSGESASEKKPAGTGGGKFRRLQMKWEMLSGKEVGINEKVSPGGLTSPGQASDVTCGSANTSVTSSGRSKIPRPVTSPVRTSGIPVLSPQQSTRSKKAVTTPPTPTSSSQLRRPSNVSSKFKINSSGAKENCDGKDIAVRPQAGKAANMNVTPVVKRQPSASTRCSRVDQLHSEEQGHGSRGHAARPSSLPYRPANTVQGNKNGQTANKTEVQRRAASSSLNRQRHSDNQEGPRYVRTLCHRLPSDSGHLSFNEGERLRLVLEVDEKWLLCCRGDQKGLVPRTAVNAGLVPRQAVIAVQDNISRF
ncbi:hypothetical protein B7P43_G03348 [Cryptotermes secundus]|uniref:RUN domain-containing protein n=1 Tax=Cryptotermes secundus TaxID=105785 RepID=A0A2J7PQZ7_9NEOP|nr:uncharacterized protein LOC111872358 isoform X2 [Cryptotermes secundus]XP_023721921.1 uncharacterized protein LOC111872358 isoform X2 [Cryptotermes secundus]XP_023721922.1 uncharacterized protein LOC111872358 isoform X2 [Cryptotermes secundus]PNF18760.1 hypothetical protein B7P43_G03348 [Cryptotermes secundus]PNF18761.1 hypothetical protein B7P43_G03348 [Cryptotermes secundus]